MDRTKLFKYRGKKIADMSREELIETIDLLAKNQRVFHGDLLKKEIKNLHEWAQKW